MTDKAWFSNVMRNYRIGYKQGIRAKFYGEDWEPPRHELADTSDTVYANMTQHVQGYTLQKDQFPEVIAIFDKKLFSRLGDIFVAGRFYAVKGRLAELFSRFNFGEGGLVPFEIYQDDLTTPVDGKFFYLNFGARKSTFLPSDSKNVELVTANKDAGVEIWKVNPWAEGKDVALSKTAMVGADVWIEEKVRNTLFLSDALVAAFREAKLKTDLELTECRIVETAQ